MVRREGDQNSADREFKIYMCPKCGFAWDNRTNPVDKYPKEYSFNLRLEERICPDCEPKRKFKRSQIKYIPGQKFKRLILIKEIESRIKPCGKKDRRAIFECFCGEEFESSITHIKGGGTTSCGCYRRKAAGERVKKHGLTKHPLYRVWRGIRHRSKNKIDPDWKNNFVVFYNWAMENGYKRGLLIDRKDNSGSYTSDNCRFITMATNSQNRKTTKLNWESVTEIRNTKLLIPNIKCKELATTYGVCLSTIHKILSNRIWNVWKKSPT